MPLLPLMFRHGLRVSKACNLVLSSVDIENRVLHAVRHARSLPPARLRPGNRAVPGDGGPP